MAEGADEGTGFAARLKALREAKGLSQAELAAAAGLALGGVTKLEQGHREPSWATALALSEALGCSLDDFRPRAGRGRKRAE